MSAVPEKISVPPVVGELRDALGSGCVDTDPVIRERCSGDLYSQGAVCSAVVRPRTKTDVSRAAQIAYRADYALIPRGGGMSYTGGYVPTNSRSIVIDLANLNEIVAISTEDMTVTVQSGVTWKQLNEALAPLGVRTPFIGTFSGARATIGGGLSNGALFFGTARYGAAADHVLGLEVVCADGSTLQTGQASIRNGKPFYRTHGPDLTGLFLHDAGSLGLKVEATLKLIQAPEATRPLSYALPDVERAASALSAIGRSGAAEEAYVFDPQSTERGMEGQSLKEDVKTLGKIVSGQKSLAAGLRAGARTIVAGKNVVPKDAYSIHLVCAGRSEAAVAGDLAICRKLLDDLGGTEIPASIPLACRATPFDHLNGVVGPKGERWAALNAKVPHSDADKIITGFERVIAPHRETLERLNIRVSTLFIAMETHAFSFEPVFHWYDDWLPMHRHVPEAGHIEKLGTPPSAPEATAFVAQLREEVMTMFNELGAASNQIGRTYAYLSRMAPETRSLLTDLKHRLDPKGLMNPGVLEFPSA